MDTSIQVLNNTIYDYFARNYGHIEAIPDKNLENKYKDHTVKDLKKALSTNPDITEIKYVSRVLRDNLRNSNNTQTDNKISHSIMINISSVTSGVMLRTFLQVSGLYYHPSTCKIAPIILEKHYLQYIRQNYLEFPAGYLHYLARKSSMTLTRQPINK